MKNESQVLVSLTLAFFAGAVFPSDLLISIPRAVVIGDYTVWLWIPLALVALIMAMFGRS